MVEAVPEDLVRVLLVERVREVSLGRETSVDTRGTTYGRNSSQLF